MFPPDTKQTVFTIEFAVAAYAHYMGMDHEEAGKEMASPDFMGGLSFIEKTPRGPISRLALTALGFTAKRLSGKRYVKGKPRTGKINC